MRREKRDAFLIATLDQINQLIEELYPPVLYELGQARNRMAAGEVRDPTEPPSEEVWELIQRANKLSSLIARLPGSDVKAACFNAWRSLAGFFAVSSIDEAQQHSNRILEVIPIAQEFANGALGQLYGPGPDESEYRAS